VTLIADDFYGVLIGIAEQLSPGFGVSRRDCGTGAGGFKPGNKCAGGGDGDGGSSGNKVRDAAFDSWRKRDSQELGGIRERIASAAEFADKLTEETKAKTDKLAREQARQRDAHDGLKEKSRSALKNLEETAMKFADEELKTRLSGMGDIRRQLFLEKNKQSDPRIEAARQERLSAVQKVGESSATLVSLAKQIDQEEELAASVARDRRAEAWREISKYSAQAATDGLEKDGDSYSKELFDKVRERFSSEMQSMQPTSVSGKVSPEEFKSFDEGPKREATEFLSMVINPATMSATSMANATLNIDNIDRAYASGNAIHVSPYSSASTVIHELGHIYESGDPNIRAAAVAFYRHRCDESQDVKMSDLSPSGGYADAEVGNADDFRKVVDAVYKTSDPYEDADLSESRNRSRSAYLGKVYKDKDGEVRATELISIGLELMHHNPAAFAKTDPEYFDFMLGVVSGKIRRARKRKA
jgi:hypothetical protein